MSIFGSINQVTLSGNMGQDPEFFVTASGTPMATISIAVDGWDPKTKSNKTMWMKAVCFEKVAENVEKWTKKGTTVSVSGKLDQSKYTDKNGIERVAWQVIASDITVLKNGIERRGEDRQMSSSSVSQEDAAAAYMAALKKLGFDSPEQMLAAARKSQAPSASNLDDLP